MITFKHKGDFGRTTKFLNNTLKSNFKDVLHRYGQMGVDALAASTPIDSGETADSWNYEITGNKNGMSVIWTNSHVNQGVNIAIILQSGHGTGTGGYVQGRDYINPAMRPIFDGMAEAIWKEVSSD